MSKDTGKARLPGLALPRLDDVALARWVQAVTERLEVREGSRGNPYERALTVRDLVGTGLVTLSGGGGVSRPPGGPGSGGDGGGIGDDLDGGYDKFLDDLRNSKLFRELMMRIDDPDRFNDLADEIKAVLLNDIADEAKRRQADVQRLDTKIQTDTRSLAMAVEEVTAAVDNASAGVRSTSFAQAERDRAIAGQITQVVARLDGPEINPADLVFPVYATLADLRAARPVGVEGKYYQVTNPVTDAPVILYKWDVPRGKYVLAGMANSAAVEQVLKATADRVTGLSAEYYVKVQAGGVFGGFGLSAHENNGIGYSQFLIAADRFAMVSPDGAVNPFMIARDSPSSPYYFYLNGQVRINAGGGSVSELGDEVVVSSTSQVFKQSTSGAWDKASVSLTAARGGTIAAATVSWSVVTGGYTGSLSPGPSLTVTRANMTTDAVTFRARCVNISGKVFSDEITIVKLVDGANALAGYLTNESHTVAANAAGTVASGGMDGAAGAFKVFLGLLDVTASCTFSTGATSGLSASISPSGTYAAAAFTGVGDVATATFVAQYSGASISKVFTVTRSRGGVAGDTGLRGSLTAYSAPSGAWLIGANWNASSTNNHHGALAIWFLLHNNYSMVTGSTAHLRIGDTVTLSSADNTKVETRYWSGSGWAQPGVVIDGNMLVRGSVSADKVDVIGLTADTAFINNLQVKAASVTGKLTSATLETDKILPGVNAANYGYQFGFGTGSTQFGYNGAGYFRSTVDNTYALAVSHSGSFPALVVNSASGIAGLFSAGGFNNPSYTATLAKNGTAAFFQYRSAVAGPSNDSHTGGALSSAKFGISTAAGQLQRDAVITWICGPNNSFGVETNAAMKAGGFYATDWITADGAVTAGAGGSVRTELSKFNRGAVQGLWTSGGAYVEASMIIGGQLQVTGACKAASFITFTGAHISALAHHHARSIEPGDICVDVRVIARSSVSDTVTEIEPSSRAAQKGAIGVYAQVASVVPDGLLQDSTDDEGEAIQVLTPQAETLLETHTLVAVNAVGEGQINVCGSGGDLEVGDLLQTSEIPGKAMRQADDLVRGYTVAKVRESVTFASPDEVRLVACVYLCG